MTNSQQYVIQIFAEEQYTDTATNTTKTRVRTLLFDAIQDPTISASNTVTDHPIASGDMIADHAYKNPLTFSFSGQVGLYGHKGFVVDNESMSLADLENLLLKIKNEAMLCSIVKLNIDNKEDVRFATYNQMVITNLQLTERINTLSFTLTFRQVLLASIEEAEVDIDDKFLPSITEPETLSFSGALLDMTQVMKAVIQALVDFKLIAQKFLQQIGDLTTVALASLIAGIAGLALLKILTGTAIVNLIGSAVISALGGAAAGAAAGTVAAGAASAAGALSATGVGAIVVVAAVTAVAFTVGIVNLFKKAIQQKKYNVKKFEAYSSEKKKNKEIQRFVTFFSEIVNVLKSLDTQIKVYQVSSNADQECLVTIDDNYYVFTFTTNNTSGKRDCTVTDINDTPVGSVLDVTSMPQTYNDCTDANKVFMTTNGKYIHLICLPYEGDFVLTNMLVVVSDFNPEEYNDKLVTIIQNSILR